MLTGYYVISASISRNGLSSDIMRRKGKLLQSAAALKHHCERHDSCESTASPMTPAFSTLE